MSSDSHVAGDVIIGIQAAMKQATAALRIDGKSLSC
jgi:hypothetical protein